MIRVLFILFVFCASIVGQDISQVRFSSDSRYLIVSWTSVDSCLCYVQISKSNSFDRVEIEDSTRNDSIRLSFNYDANTIYYCRVIQKSLSLRSFSSEIISFYTPAVVSIAKYSLRNVTRMIKTSTNFTLQGRVTQNSKISNILVSKLSKKITFSSF